MLVDKPSADNFYGDKMNTLNLFFDLDGTITDPFEGITNSIIYALEKFGISVEDRSKLKPFIGPPLLHSFKTFYSLSDEDAKRAVKLYREYYSETGIFEAEVYNDIPEVLARLGRLGFKRYIATSKPEPYAERIVEKFGLSNLFDGIAGASFDSSRAEKTQVITYAKLRFNAHEGIMIGDRKYDIEGAKLNSLKSLGVTYGYGDKAELEGAGADYIAHSPLEILDVIALL